MINVKILQKVPSDAGVYQFLRNRKPLYIGKAANLKKRLSSYWRKNTSDKIQRMLKEATKLEWVEAESEIAALLKESELIKKYRPKYNILMRDDKNYFYIGITSERYPKIFVTHQLMTKDKGQKTKAQYIGPFTNGSALKETLRLLRRVFPYCTCKQPHKRPCLNAQIGRCLGYCCTRTIRDVHNTMHKNEYKKNVQNITAVLGGKKKRILLKLKQEMRGAAKKQNFELAAKLRDQIAGLENVFGHRMSWKNHIKARPSNWNKIENTLRTILQTSKNISRVEGYDISNISGTEATGSMVVFIEGRPAKSEYRKFKIKTVRGANDIAMHREVIRRRLRHSEWKYPDLMLIDGGKMQLNAALKSLKFKSLKSGVPAVAALAKREEELYTKERKLPIRLSTLPRETALFLQYVRNESHRFAKKYHHKLREKLYRQT